MRHLVSIVVAPVLGLVAYILMGFALVRGAEAGGALSGDGLVSLAAAVAAGAAYAALLLPRLSPIGPLLVGLSYLGLGLWALGARDSLTGRVPTDLPVIEEATVLAAGPVTVALAVPLLATVLSRRRWRRHPYPAAGDHPTMALAPYGSPPPPHAPGGYPGGAPVGAPYSGPPAYQSGSETVPLGYAEPPPGPYGAPPPPGYPPRPLDPDETQRI